MLFQKTSLLQKAAACLLLLASSCKKNMDAPASQDGIAFSSSIEGIATRASGATWDANDAIGVFAKNSGGVVTDANKKYTTTGNGNFTAGGEDAINYPEDGSSLSFSAHYPYNASTVGDTYTVNVATQTNQAAIDLMYAENTTGYNKKSTTTPNLNFTHQLSKIELIVKAGADVTSVAGVTADFQDFNTRASFDLGAGTLSGGTAPATIAANMQTSGADPVASAIMLPVADASGKTVLFTLPSGENYTLTLPAATKFESGKKYIYTVSLRKKPTAKAVILGMSTVTPWIEVPGGNITAPETSAGTNEWDNNPYKLNVVYFVPTDMDTLANYRERLSVIMLDIQEFYAQNMSREGYGRRSFGLDRPNRKMKVIVIRGTMPKSSYTSDKQGNIVQEVEAYFNANPTEKKSLHSIIFTPQYPDGMSQAYNGYNTNCLVIDYPALGSTLLRGGGEAHELGHALNLPHNGETQSTKISLGTALMGNGVYTYKDKPTFLTAADCAILSRSQTLATVRRADWYTPQDLFFVRGKAEVGNNTFRISGKFEASMPVAKVVVYHDPTPYGTNSDYDAITFTGNIVGADSFNVASPLGDFFNTTSLTQLRLKFVFENGYTVNKNIEYTFTGNQPNTANFFPAAVMPGATYQLLTLLNNTSGMNVAGGLTADETRVLLWTASSPPVSHELWKITDVGSGYYKLEPQNAIGKALEVAGSSSANYSAIQISTYGGTSGQRWKLRMEMDGYELAPACAPTSRVDVTNTSTADGNRLQLFQSNGNKAQRWKLVQQ